MRCRTLPRRATTGYLLPLAAALALLACSAGNGESGGGTGASGAGAGAPGAGGAGGSASGAGGEGGLSLSGGAGGGVPCTGGTGAGCDCGELSFDIDTQQACAMSILPGYQMDGEGFITVQNQQHRVFAIDRWGSGHVIGWCDATTLPQLLAAFDALGYLGQVDTPKVASFGDEYLCQPGALPNSLPNSIVYQGFDLPAQYQGNAAALAADWDVVVFCGFRIGWPYDWSAEIAEFVSVRGKGFLAAMDYEGVVQQADFTNMSKITSGDGIVFDPLNLPWAPAAANVSLDCVPDIPPPK